MLVADAATSRPRLDGGQVTSDTDEREFRADPLVRIAAWLLDPLAGAEIPPGPTAAELIEAAERSSSETSSRLTGPA